MRPRLVDALSALLGGRMAELLIPTGPMLYAAAILVMVLVAARRARRGGLDPYHLLGIALWAAVGGLVGARVLFLVQHARETILVPSEIVRLGGGTASWGAYIGALVGLMLYAARHGLPIARYADVAASVAGLGIMLGRLACFLNGDDFGTATNLPWGVRFPHASMPFVAQVREGLVSPVADLSLPVHPVQLYLALNGLAVFLLLSWGWRAWRNRPGVVFCLFWVVDGVMRFGLEYFRGDQPHLTAAGLTPPQVIVLAVIGPALWGVWFSGRPGSRAPQVELGRA
jgi:phosphatidylglycerol:prolipoprotein diacylglycerol transferase